ncbi:MAG: NAD(P)-dependent oxidoreductase [Propylenella sp.]
MAERPRIGFIGIGMLGSAVVERLLARGWSVAVWNREPERYALVEPKGARPMASPAAVAEASDILFTCVLHGPAVENCCFGPAGIAEAKNGARTLIDLSTINPDETLALAPRLKAANGMDWLDAPVSGGPPAAREGKLTIMVGGDAAVLEHCRAVLAEISGNLTHMGPLGAGQTTKILNQAIVGTGYVLMAETLALAKEAGIDPALLPQALAGGLADGGVLQKVYPVMAEDAFSRPFGSAHQLNKDMQNVKKFAEKHGCELPVVKAAVEQYRRFTEAGNEMAEGMSISRFYRRSG